MGQVLMRVNVLWWTIACLCSPGNGQPMVQAPAGTFIGVERSQTIDGRDYKIHKYLGIPFAEPPIGNLRFKKPVSNLPLTQTFHATRYGAACRQVTIEGVVPIPDVISEDCLFLNVYVPAGATSQKPATGYSVMVWIHGGGFQSGESKLYHADTLSAYGDVIVVTFNYRLAAQGFFSTGDESAPGNYGLWDQHLAIRWVHENIASFGGDANKVTIAGESAGAVSVLFQASYPGNKGLFQRAICESGSPTAPFGFAQKPSLGLLQLAARTVGCADSLTMNTSEIVDCFRNLTNEVIAQLGTPPAVPLRLVPTFDNDFITINPSNFVKLADGPYGEGHSFFASLDLMNSMTSAEGGLFVGSSTGVSDMENFKVSPLDLDGAVRACISDRLGGEPYPDVLADLVRAGYTDWERSDDPTSLRDMYVELFTDAYFVIPALEYSKKHASLKGSGSNYLAQFSARPSNHLIKPPSWLKGANHGDDLFFVFGFDQEILEAASLPGNPVVTPKPWEYNLSRVMMTMITNFAKTGNPNPPPNVAALMNFTWPEYDLKSQKYFQIDRVISPDSVKTQLAAKADNLWLTIFPQIVERHCKPRPALVSSSSCQSPIFLSVIAFIFVAEYFK